MTLPYKKILVPLDGSTLAAQALPHAQALAENSDAALILFRVVPELRESMDQPNLEFDGMRTQKAQEGLVDRAMEALIQKAEELQHLQFEPQAVVEEGDPADAIVDYASRNDIDLIVMSTHGRTGVSRWVYGSVAGKVLQAAPCPILLIRASVA